jgi:hypothetical protein
MEKIKVTKVGLRFKELSQNTPNTLRYSKEDRTIILEVEGFEPLLICCDNCEGEKFVQEGAMSRCINCNSLFLIGFR